MRRHRVLHVGPTANPDSVNGVNQHAWSLGTAQASDHDVAFLVEDAAESDIFNAERRGIRLVSPHGVLSEFGPDVIHFHSVFIPMQARLARAAASASVPFVIQPNGGVAPQVLSRRRMKKWIYSTLIERPRFRSAAALIAVLPPEAQEIKRFTGTTCGPVLVIPNAIEPPPHLPPVDDQCEDAVFLGRFDTLHKGLDRLARLARVLPEVSFGLYGEGDRTSLPDFPENVSIHSPVFGDEKWRVLRSAKCYLHVSRWEAFGLSIFEAMLVGTPPVVASEAHAAEIVEALGGQVIDADSPEASRQRILNVLGQRSSLQPLPGMSEAVSELVSPQVVAERTLNAYAVAMRS